MLALGESIVYAAAAMGHKLLIIAALVVASACAPQLGDECETALECSANGTRTCDVSQPGGYCTIASCEPESCGDEGYCVRFKPDEPRLSIDWCMAKCSDNGDCRSGYACRTAAALNSAQQGDGGVDGGGDGGVVGDGGDDRTEPRVAEVLDSNKDGKFCVVRE